jgi:hypothetical protein
MPEETFQRWDDRIVDVLLDIVDFSAVPVHFLNKVRIFSKKLADWVDASQYNFGLQRDHNLD